jgi:hypothetical protein
MLLKVADTAYSHALVVENVGACVGTEKGARDIAYVTVDIFAAVDGMENRHDAAAVRRRLQLPYTLPPR